MNRGYAGYYNGYYLRSSYEYAYAKYLDYHNIKWGYEERNFDVTFKIYKPDFFIYDENGFLVKVVEVKSRNKEALLNAKKALEAIETLYSIRCELISYNELLLLYKELPYSLTSTILKWINSNKTTLNKACCGELNGHFNLKHKESTKRKIGEHTKRRWATDGIIKQRMIEGLRKSGQSQKGKIKTPRELRTCKNCSTTFEVLVTSSAIYCSQSCAGSKAIENALEVYLLKRKDIHNNIRDYIIKWSQQNKGLVQLTPLNKIKTTIKPLLFEIERQFGVKDFRVISKSVFGEDRGKKELINFMKEISKNV